MHIDREPNLGRLERLERTLARTIRVDKVVRERQTSVGTVELPLSMSEVEELHIAVVALLEKNGIHPHHSPPVRDRMQQPHAVIDVGLTGIRLSRFRQTLVDGLNGPGSGIAFYLLPEDAEALQAIELPTEALRKLMIVRSHKTFIAIERADAIDIIYLIDQHHTANLHPFDRVAL